MRESQRKAAFLIVLLGVFAAMLALNLLTPLVADDYMYAFSFATGERISSVGEIFPSLAAHAREMNGRLTPHFFVQLFTLLPRQVFGAVNALVYLAFTLGLYWLACGTERYDVRLLCAVEGAVFLLPPAFGQSFLWMAGSVNYLWCDTLMVYLLIPFADAMFRGRDRPKAATQALMGVGALAFGNMSENVSAAAVALMALCVAWMLLRRRRVRAWMLVTPLAAGAGWLALMLSPANRANVSRAAGGAGAMLRNFEAAMEMFMNKGLWLSLAFLALLALWTVRLRRPDSLESRSGAEPHAPSGGPSGRARGAEADRAALAVGLFVCALLCNFAMTGSGYYPERAFTGTCVMLIAACALLIGDLPRGLVPLGRALALCLAFAMAMTALGALPNAYDRYRLAQARVQEVCRERDEGKSRATTFGVAGKSKYDAFYGLNELTDDTAYFPNVYYARYYGLDSVVIDRME